MTQLAWYLKRFRVMSGREILHRLRQPLTVTALLIRARLLDPDLPSGLSPGHSPAFRRGNRPHLPALPFDLHAVRSVGPDLLEGRLTAFGRVWQWRPTPEIWHRAPDTGHLWPRRLFTHIPFRAGNAYGDIRQVWEPARLQQLVDLAVLARIAPPRDRQRAVRMVNAQLASWVEDNPPFTGPHYVSAMECALRLIAVCHALDMLRQHLSDDMPWRSLVTLVASHAPLIASRLSLHSSTGNHTIAEGAGLVYAGLLFPEFGDASHWLATGLDVMITAASEQILSDGGGAEQALAYHLCNLQLLGLVQALLLHHGRPVPTGLGIALHRGRRFLSAMTVAGSRLPSIGDSDSGHALSRYLLLCRDTVAAVPAVRTFRESGYTVARIGAGPPLTLILDHGTLGMPPAHGHGHADALALLLSVGDEDVLVDTGTYTYTGDQRWRRYFRGTRAHNTVTVDGRDQATQEASFLWSGPFRARLIATAVQGVTGGRLLAEHDGYRLQGVRHVRGVAWCMDRWLLIRDMLWGRGHHRFELNWHLGKHPVWKAEGVFELQAGGATLEVHCHGGMIATHCAERTPIAGWRSPAYGTLESITTVSLLHQGRGPHAFSTLIRLPGFRPSDNSIEDALTWMTDHSRRGPNAWRS